jgi:hypothetical protein
MVGSVWEKANVALFARLDPIFTGEKSYYPFLHHVEINDDYLIYQNLLDFPDLEILRALSAGLVVITFIL